jgi:hypothetical protein
VSGRLRASQFDNVATRVVDLLGVQTYLGAMVYGSFAHEFFGHFGHGVQAHLAYSICCLESSSAHLLTSLRRPLRVPPVCPRRH